MHAARERRDFAIECSIPAEQCAELVLDVLVHIRARIPIIYYRVSIRHHGFIGLRGLVALPHLQISARYVFLRPTFAGIARKFLV